jgi:hypothetical protein
VGAPRARDAWIKFTKIYENPRVAAARAPCVDFAAAKNTVEVLFVKVTVFFKAIILLL